MVRGKLLHPGSYGFFKPFQSFSLLPAARKKSLHYLKNAIMPVITYLGPLVAGLLTGSCIVEKMFSIAGIGRYFVDSISNRDYTMIMGITVFFGIFVVVCNLVVDILQAIIDPRVKLDAK